MDPRVAQALEFIEQRLSERLTVRDLAVLVNLSPSGFAHLFRASIGTSPIRYLRQRRMERARELLECTSLPVREVMRQVGCPDPSHFSKDFRASFGMRPRDCRGGHELATAVR